MKFFTATLTLASLVPAILGLTINTPVNVRSCEPTQLTWSDGQAPYYLSILPPGQPSAAPLKTFATQNGNSYTWTVDILGVTSVTFAIKDSTGATAYSDIVTIQAPGDIHCLDQLTSSGSSPTASASSTGPASNPPGTATATATVTNHSPSATNPTGTHPAATVSPTTTRSAGSKSSVASFGLAGLAGLVGLAIL